MVLIEVHHGGLRAWAILHCRAHIGRELPGMHLPTSADGLHGVVLCDFIFHDRQIKNLACFCNIRKGQFTVTRLAMVWYVMHNNFVGLCDFTQGVARVALLPARWFYTSTPQGLRCGFVQAVA